MLNMLVPIEGSTNSDRAVDYLIKLVSRLNESVSIHLLNVQYPLHGEVGMFLGGDQIKDYHHDEGIKALSSARKLLDDAGIDYTFHIVVGEPDDMVIRYAQEHQCDQIVLGTRGLGKIAQFFLDSVSSRIIEQSSIPILLVR